MPIEQLNHGINRTFRKGDRFYKISSLGGSPHAEAAVNRGFHILGLPHVPTTTKTFGKLVGTEAPFIHGMTPIAQLHHEQAKEAWGSPDRHLNTLLGEYLFNVSDRHGANYAHVPGQGVVSIDHGIAIHPATSYWHDYANRGESLRGEHQLRTGPYEWSYHPKKSALVSLMQLGLSSDSKHLIPGRVNPDVLATALARRHELEELIHHGTHGLPEEERGLARLAYRARVRALEHYASAGHPLDIHALANAHHRALEYAQEHLS